MATWCVVPRRLPSGQTKCNTSYHYAATNQNTPRSNVRMYVNQADDIKNTTTSIENIKLF